MEAVFLEGGIAHQSDAGANLHLRKEHWVGTVAGNLSPMLHFNFTVTIVLSVVKCGRKAPGYPLVSHGNLSPRLHFNFTVTIVLPVVRCGRKAPGYPLVSHKVFSTTTCTTTTSPSTHGQAKPLVKGTRKGRENPAVDLGLHRLLHRHAWNTHRPLHLSCVDLCKGIPW